MPTHPSFLAPDRQHFDWPRFVAHLGEDAELEDGLLIDPAGSFGRALNRSALRLADLADRPCVVLVGEPGIGKSSALRDEAARLRTGGARVASPVDLGAYDTEDGLQRALFGTAEWQEWVGSTHVLTMFAGPAPRMRRSSRTSWPGGSRAISAPNGVSS